MARVTFRKGIEANLPTQGLAEEGCVYFATDTGNVYVGDSNGSLVPLNRSPYYGTCSSVGSTNSKVVTLDVEDDNFSLYVGAMISVRFDNANIASSPTLNVNGTGAVAVKDYGTTNIDTSSEAWSDGEVVTFVYDGSYWQRVGSKKKVSELHSRGWVGETGSADSIATTTGVLTFKNIARVAANSFPGTSNANAILDINTYSNNSYNHQIGFSSNGKLYHRYRGGSWAAWKELYHLGDYISTSYLQEPNCSISTPTLLSLVGTMRANRLSLLPPEQVIVEKTTDGGNTWEDAGVTDAQKRSLFHGTRDANIPIPKIDGVKNKLCGLRITITGVKYDVPTNTPETQKYNYWNSDYYLSSERYCFLCGMYFWITAISDSIRVRVYRSKGSTPNNWNTADSGTNMYMTGSSGGNYIRLSESTFGGSSATNHFWNYRIELFTDGVDGGDLSANNAGSSQYLFRIFGYGSKCWKTSNNLMFNDHLYDWDFDQTMITPSTVMPAENVSTADLGATDGRWRKIYGVDEDLSGDIRANRLIKVGGTSAQFLKADGSVDSNTYLTESSGSGTFVKVKPVRGFYNNNDSWNAYFSDSSFNGLKYIRITLPDTSVNVWAMLYFEFSIMQNYNANRYGKLLLFGMHSSSATATWSLNGALSGTLENIFVYGSDKKYIYIKGVQRYGSISINKIMSGDGVSLIDISDISIDVVDSLPETYQTATIKATSGFDNITVGSSSKPIYLNNGTPTEISRFPEALLMWGGMNYSGGYGPVDAAMVSELGACRTMFSKAAGIVVEYSTDGGATWLDYGATDEQKMSLFSTGSFTFYTGKNSTAGGGSANNMLRVNLFTGPAGVYTTLNKFVIYLSTNGSTDCYCTIRARTQENYENNVDTWNVLAEEVPVNGWSGYNVINTNSFTTYGYAATQHSQIQFIFGCAGFSGNYTGLAIYKIFGFGGVGWATPSNMAKTGHLYGYDSLQNATFPANITAEKFIKTGGTSSQFLMADGSVGNGMAVNGYSNNVFSFYYNDENHNLIVKTRLKAGTGHPRYSLIMDTSCVTSRSKKSTLAISLRWNTQDEVFYVNFVTGTGSYTPDIYAFTYTEEGEQYIALGFLSGPWMDYRFSVVNVTDQQMLQGWSYQGSAESIIPEVGTDHCIKLIYCPTSVVVGGTGSNTDVGAEYNLTPNLANEINGNVADTTRVAIPLINQNTTNGRFAGWYSALKFWTYMRSKISSVLGISSTTDGIPLAPTADYGTNTTRIATTEFVEFAKEAILSKGENLVINGNGYLGNNTNFTGMTFDNTESRGSYGSFSFEGRSAKFSDKYFPINPFYKYKISVDIKGTRESTCYIFLNFADYDNNPIRKGHCLYVSGTEAELSQALNNGDTVMHVNDLSGWNETTSNQYFVSVFNYQNSAGYTYPPYTYTRTQIGYGSNSNLDLANNTITLSSAWNGETIPAGTKIAKSRGGTGSYFYASIVSYDTEWEHVQGYINAHQQNEESIPFAAIKANFGILLGYGGVGDITSWITNVEVTALQETLVSGVNIKTINNESLLGSGNITIQGGGGGTSTDVRINGTSITDNNVANIVTEGAYNALTNKIATMSDLPNDANVVHKTGNETIAGVKTFTDNVVVGESKQVVLNMGQDGYVYLEAWADNSGKTLSVLDENDFDVRLQGVDTPIANNDAANKAYVDSVASGGASLNVGNSKVFFGTSTTGASTTTKDVTCADFTSSDLVEGVMVLVKFSTKNTGAVASLKLNVNGTGAYNIKKIYYTSGVTNLTNAAEIAADSVIPFIFTGSYWLVAGLDYNKDTTYSAMTSAAIVAGTETTGRLVTAKLLKDNLVYKTGNENVAGVKTFTDGVLVKDSDFGIVSESQNKHSVYLSVDNYYDDGSDGIGVLSLDDPSGYGDVIVRCVANPIRSTDAANKAYVDSAIGGSRSILDGCSGIHGLKKYSICAVDAVDDEMYPFINQSTNVVESGVSFRIGTNIYYYEGDDMGSEDDFTGVPFYTSNSNVPLSRNMIGSFSSADLPVHCHYYMKVTVNSSNGTWSPSAGSSGTLIVHQNLLEQGCFYIHLGYENGEQDSFTLEEENPLYYFNGTNLVPYESYETSNCVHKTGTETIGGAKTFSTSCTVPNPTNMYHAATKKYVDDIVGDIETLLAAI